MGHPAPTLHQLLEQSAQRIPNQIAVVDPERDKQISYAAFDSLTNEIQQHLTEAGVVPGDRVGVYIPKSIGSISTIFGILKAEAAYIPVDPTAPPSRNAFIFKDCTVRCFIVDNALYEGIASEFDDQYGLEPSQIECTNPYGIDLTLVKVTPKKGRSPVHQ